MLCCLGSIACLNLGNARDVDRSHQSATTQSADQASANTATGGLTIQPNTQNDRRDTGNIGTFSGGAPYLMVVCVVLVAGFVTMFWLFVHRGMAWRSAFEGLTNVVALAEKVPSGDQVSRIKRDFNEFAQIRGLKKLTDRSLKQRGLIK